jgi:hypothetical protein
MSVAKPVEHRDEGSNHTTVASFGESKYFLMAGIVLWIGIAITAAYYFVPVWPWQIGAIKWLSLDGLQLVVFAYSLQHLVRGVIVDQSLTRDRRELDEHYALMEKGISRDDAWAEVIMNPARNEAQRVKAMVRLKKKLASEKTSRYHNNSY